jgi:hypothetical protein
MAKNGTALPYAGLPDGEWADAITCFDKSHMRTGPMLLADHLTDSGKAKLLADWEAAPTFDLKMRELESWWRTVVIRHSEDHIPAMQRSMDEPSQPMTLDDLRKALGLSRWTVWSHRVKSRFLVKPLESLLWRLRRWA